MFVGVMGPLAAGHGQSPVTQAADRLTSSFVSTNKHHGCVFVGSTELSYDLRTAAVGDIVLGDTHSKVPDIHVSVKPLIIYVFLL